jgi:hypothetical protein
MLSGGHGQSDEVEIGFFFNPNTDVNIKGPHPVPLPPPRFALLPCFNTDCSLA